MREFAQLLSLKDVRLRTLQSYYRHLRLLGDHYQANPKSLSQSEVTDYILFVKNDKNWAASTIRQSIASARMFFCEMLGKKWSLWDVVKSRDPKRLPVVLTIEEVAAILGKVALLRLALPCV